MNTTEVMLNRGDRVKRKDGKSFGGEHMIAIVDCDKPFDKRGRPAVFVEVRNVVWNTTMDVFVDEIEKMEDYKISIDEFFVDLSAWLNYKVFESKEDGADGYASAYRDTIKKVADLKKHIGY